MHSAQAAKIAKVICWFYESILGALGVGAVQEPKVGFKMRVGTFDEIRMSVTGYSVIRSHLKNGFHAESSRKCHADPAVLRREKHP